MAPSSKKQIKYPIESPDVVKTDLLVPMEYQYQGQRDIDIVIRQPEYTSVCPMTGLPDVGCHQDSFHNVFYLLSVQANTSSPASLQ